MIFPTSRRLVVGVAGGTGSGKSTVGRRIIEALGRNGVACLDQDSYYRDLSHLPRDRRAACNFDHPDAIEFPLLAEHVRRLRDGEAVEKPDYSFTLHTRTGRFSTVRPADVVLVEGILVLADETLRATLDIKLFVDADDDIRLSRRLVRDIQERGRALEEVLDQYMGTVRPMHLAFVEPSKRYADVVIPGGGMNEVAVAMVVGTLRDWAAARARERGDAP
ncbi:MAG: uridine kinase [Deltaproteobacteria bacterium]|nr:uridine kinase [Deltaproteobacteria bacterium]